MNIPRSTPTSNKNQYTGPTSLYFWRTYKVCSTTKCSLGLSCISHLILLLLSDSCIAFFWLTSQITSQSFTYFFVKLRLQENPSTNMHLSSLRTSQSTMNPTGFNSQFSKKPFTFSIGIAPFILKVASI